MNLYDSSKGKMDSRKILTDLASVLPDLTFVYVPSEEILSKEWKLPFLPLDPLLTEGADRALGRGVLSKRACSNKRTFCWMLWVASVGSSGSFGGHGIITGTKM